MFYYFQVNLLDGKRSLNINIFLRQFRRLVVILQFATNYLVKKSVTNVLVVWGLIFCFIFSSSNEDIIQMILDGEHDDFGAEKLKGLMKILPEMDEIEMLKSFDGDKSKLGNAEKFILQLVDVPK